MHGTDRRHSRGRWPDPLFAIGVLAAALNLCIGNSWNPLAVTLSAIWTSCLFVARFGYRRRHNLTRSLLALVGYAALYCALLKFHMQFDGLTPFIFYIPALCAYAMPEAVEAAVVSSTLIGLCLTYVTKIGTLQVINYSFGVATTSILWVMIFRLMMRIETERDRYYRLSVTDSMTGLLTLGKALELGQAALSRGESVGLAIIDLDGFKQINDTFGHLAGNRVLTEFAYRLSAAATRLCPDCVVGRLGGDEFVVIIPNLTGTDAFDALSESLAGETYRPAPQIMPRPLPFSLGCSLAAAGSARSIEELMHEADLSMYAHKRETAGERAGGAAETAATSHMLS